MILSHVLPLTVSAKRRVGTDGRVRARAMAATGLRVESECVDVRVRVCAWVRVMYISKRKWRAAPQWRTSVRRATLCRSARQGRGSWKRQGHRVPTVLTESCAMAVRCGDGPTWHPWRWLHETCLQWPSSRTLRVAWRGACLGANSRQLFGGV